MSIQKGSGLKIVIRYTTSLGHSSEQEISPNDYFDPDGRDSERYDVEDVPRYQDLHSYLDVDAIIVANLEIVDVENGSILRVESSYWDDYESECTRSYLSRGNSDDVQEEIIISQKFLDPIEGWFVIRLQKQGVNFLPTSKSFVRQNSDGTQTDHPM